MPVADDIREALRAVIVGLGLTPTPVVKVRKRLAVTADDGNNVVVIAQPDQDVTEPFPGLKKLVTYPVVIAYAAKRGNTLGAAGADVTNWKDQVETAIFKPGLTGAATVSGVVPAAGIPFAVPGLDDNWDWSTSALSIESIEPRN